MLQRCGQTPKPGLSQMHVSASLTNERGPHPAPHLWVITCLRKGSVVCISVVHVPQAVSSQPVCRSALAVWPKAIVFIGTTATIHLLFENGTAQQVWELCLGTRELY